MAANRNWQFKAKLRTIPSGGKPSITPSTPLPWSVSATITSTGFAVAQNTRLTLGTILIAFKTLTG